MKILKEDHHAPGNRTGAAHPRTPATTHHKLA
jgi:hypothetical protein